MKTTINCFLPFSRLEETVQTVKELRASTLVDKIYLLASPITNVCIPGCELISVEKMDGVQKPAPVIDYQPGSLRDDFNFGSVLLFNANAFKEVIENTEEEYQ